MGPFYDHKTGHKYWVRKKDLSYFELRKLYPPKPIEIGRPVHIFAKKHHMALKPEHDFIIGYAIAAVGIGFYAFIVIVYLTLLARAYL